jgi:hypothetical protein
VNIFQFGRQADCASRIEDDNMDHPTRIYVDETYGDDNSFLIQAAIALPAGNVETVWC